VRFDAAGRDVRKQAVASRHRLSTADSWSLLKKGKSATTRHRERQSSIIRNDNKLDRCLKFIFRVLRACVAIQFFRSLPGRWSCFGASSTSFTKGDLTWRHFIRPLFISRLP
jgi:hypothetical protein